MRTPKEIIESIGPVTSRRALNLLVYFVARQGEGERYVTLTDASEILGGTSGRGSKTFKDQALALADLGLLEKVTVGRTTYLRPRVGVTELVNQDDLREISGHLARSAELFGPSSVKPVYLQ